jgi:hypothetical protein
MPRKLASTKKTIAFYSEAKQNSSKHCLFSHWDCVIMAAFNFISSDFINLKFVIIQADYNAIYPFFSFKDV